MAKFCGQCGAPAGEQRFCGSCGAPLHAAPAPTPAPVEPMSDHTAIRPPLEDDGRTVTRPQRAAQAAPQQVQQQPAPQQQTAPTQPWPAAPQHPQQPVQQQAPQGWPAQPGGPGAYAPPHAQHQGQQQWGGPTGPVSQAPQRPPRAVPLVNPFLGVPVADFVKDGAAALALLVALGQPWDWSSDANDHWWVVISLLLALVGLGVPYLMASRAVPTFTPQASLVTKLLLAAPLLVSTLVALVMDLTTIGDDSFLGAFGSYASYDGGMGLAIALGLGGAALMAQPRRHEEATGLLAEQAWRTAALAAAVAALVVSVATFVAGSIALADGGYVSGATFWTVWIASNLVLPTLFLALPLVALLRGSAGGRRTFAVLAWGVVLVTLVAEPDGSGAVTGSQVEGWASPAGGVWLLALAGALLLSRPSVRRTQDDEVGGWLATVQVSLATAAALALGAAVLLLLVMTMFEMFPGVVIALTLMYLGVAVAAGVAASMGANLAMRVAVSAAAAVAIVLGVVMWAVVASSDAASIAQAQFTARDVVILFALPALALYALWVPVAVRAQAPRQAPAAAWGQPSYPQQGPGQQGPGQPWSPQGDQHASQPSAGQWGPPGQG